MAESSRARYRQGGQGAKSSHKGIIAASAAECVVDRILLVRGQKVILDSDLAVLYGVPTKRLNEQVKRNIKRFPPDFMFQLSTAERAEVVAICDHLQRLKFSSNLPYAFTEHGAIMAASVLNSNQAIQTSVFVVRAFVQLRQMLGRQKHLANRIEGLEKAVADHDEQIVLIVDTIRLLMPPEEEPPREPFGFRRAKKS